MYYFRSGCAAARRCVDFNYIKSGLKGRRIGCKINGSGSTDFVLLPPVHCLPGRGKCRRFSKLYLHKNNVFIIAYNQIYLAKSAVISAGQKFVPLLTKIFRSDGFPPRTQQLTSRHRTSSGRSFYGPYRDHTLSMLHNGLLCHNPYEFQNHTGDILLPSAQGDHLLLP